MRSKVIKKTYYDDPINRPSYYTYGTIETIDYIEQVATVYPSEQAPSVANVIKYISRAPLKNGVEDLEKAKFYIDRLISHEKKRLAGEGNKSI